SVAAAHDAHLLCVRDPLTDNPVFTVEQIGVHRAGPLAITGVQVLLAVSGGSAKVGLQNGIAAVGQPLRVGIVSPEIAAPRTSVGKYDHGQLFGFFVRGRGQVTVDGHSVASFIFNRPHLRQLELFQRGTIAEEHGGLFGSAVVEVVVDGSVIALVGDNPLIVGEVAADVADVGVADLFESSEIGGDVIADGLEISARAQEDHGFQLAGFRMSHGEGHVVLRVFGDDGALAGGQVERKQAGSVGIDRADDEQRFVVGAEVVDIAQGLVGAPLDEFAPGRIGVVADAADGAAVGSIDLGGAHDEIVIGLPAGNVAGVLRIEGDLAGRQVRAVDVKDVGIALVELDERAIGKGGFEADHLGANFFVRSEVARLFGGKGGLIDAPVFVTILILRVEDVLRVVLPEEIADAALAVIGNDTVVGFAEGSNPDVEHTLIGGEVGKHGTVGRDFGRSALRVAEEDVSRNQRRGGLGKSRGTQTEAEDKNRQRARYAHKHFPHGTNCT